ncbi:MAG: TonB-dependent receptor [Bacteriovorax sp.]|nr:TonB-dependent receptor [Bacteriovorax sp.]
MKKYVIFLVLVHIQAFADSNLSRVEELANLPIEELLKVRIISIATGTKKPVAEAPAIASVITAQEIDAMGATTLDEVLEAAPGLHVSVGQGYGSTYLINGIGSRPFNPEALLMINGTPIKLLYTGDTIMRSGFLPVKMISRIEIIRGPGSALYGADAFSGVINVITKDASEIHGTQAGGGVANFGTQHAWVQYGEEIEEFKIGIMADYRNTDGYKGIITSDAQSKLDKALGTHASLAPGPVGLSQKETGLFLDIEKEKWRLRTSYFGQSNLGLGQGAADSLDPNGRRSVARETIDLTYHDLKLGEYLDFTSKLAYQHESVEFDNYALIFPPGANLGKGVFPNGALGSPEFFGRQFWFNNSLLFTGIELHRLRLAGGYYLGQQYRVKNSKNSTPDFTPLPDIINVSGTALNFNSKKTRNSYYGYAQDEWRIADNFEFTYGARIDHYSDFGSTFNPRTALVWKTTSDLTMKLLYGRAFRAPTFLELYNINNLITLGNPNLRPETIDTYELGGDYRFTSNWQANFNFFHYRANELINFVKDHNATTATAQNIGSQNGNGFSLETNIKMSQDILLTANYSYIKTTNENSGKSAGDYPNQKIYARSDWEFRPNWYWDTQITWIGIRDREPTDPRDPLKGYATADLVLRRKSFFKHFDAMATVRNLFDADVREPSAGPGPTSQTAAIPNDLPMAGRNFYGELSYHF